MNSIFGPIQFNNWSTWLNGKWNFWSPKLKIIMCNVLIYYLIVVQGMMMMIRQRLQISISGFHEQDKKIVDHQPLAVVIINVTTSSCTDQRIRGSRQHSKIIGKRAIFYILDLYQSSKIWRYFACISIAALLAIIHSLCLSTNKPCYALNKAFVIQMYLSQHLICLTYPIFASFTTEILNTKICVESLAFAQFLLHFF